jgi:hypothetical protein
MRPAEASGPSDDLSVLRRLAEGAAQDSPAWEMIGPGRYMPRRIRGSFRGRELG